MSLCRYFLMTLFILFAGFSPHALAKLEVGQSFPKFSIQHLASTTSEDLQKLVKAQSLTIVDFWASWCAPCEASLPVLNDLYSRYKSKGLMIIGINVDEELSAGRDFAIKFKVSFPAYYDRDRKLTELLGVSTMPTTYFIDRRGKVILLHYGFRDGDRTKLESEIKKILK